MISAMVMAMSMTSINASAQPNGRERSKERVERREPRKEGNRNSVHNRPGSNHGPERVANAHSPRKGKDNHYVPRGGRLVKCTAPRVERRCEPVPPHVHHSPRIYAGHPTAGEVAVGVVAGTVLGCIIGSLAN